MTACVVGVLCLVGQGAYGYFFGPLLSAVALEAIECRRAAYIAWVATIALWVFYPIAWVIKQ